MSRTESAPPPAAAIGRVARGGLLNLSGAVVSAFSNLLLTVAVARGMSASQTGAFFTVSSLFLLIASLSALGSRNGLVYFIAQLRAVGDYDLVPRCLRVALTPVAAVTTFLALMLAVLARPLAELLVPGDVGSATSYLRVLALFLPAAALLDGVLGATRGYGQMRTTVVVENLSRPLVQLIGVLLVASLGTAAVVIAWSFPYLPALVVGLIWLARLRQRDVHREPTAADTPSTPVVRVSADGLRSAYWRFTLPRALSNTLQVGLQRLDVILVAGFLGSVQSAMYVASSRLLVLGAFGVQAVALAVQPAVAAHYSRGERAQVNQLYRTSTAWLVLATWPLYLVGAMFAPTVLLVFGHEYVAGAHVLVILAFATMLSTACGVVDIMLMMAGRTTWLLGNVVGALTVNVVLNIVLIPRMGIEGAAWAWAAAIVVNNVVPLMQLRFGMDMHPFGSSLVVSTTAAVGCYAPIGLVALLLLGQGFAALVTCCLLGTAAYLAVLWSQRDRLAIDELLGAVRAPWRRRAVSRA